MNRGVRYHLFDLMLTVRMASPVEQDACVPSTSGQPHPLTPKSPVKPRGFEFLSTDEETVAPPPTPRSTSQAARLRDALGSDLEGWSLGTFRGKYVSSVCYCCVWLCLSHSASV